MTYPHSPTSSEPDGGDRLLSCIAAGRRSSLAVLLQVTCLMLKELTLHLQAAFRVKLIAGVLLAQEQKCLGLDGF
jgi:hypothetical protein